MASKTHFFQHRSLSDLTTNARYLGLLTASPGDAGAATNEVSGNGYARQLVSWPSPTDLANGASMANTAAVAFPAATGGGWGTVTHGALFDAATGGNMWVYAPLGTSASVVPGYVVSFPAGNISDLDQ